MALVGMLIDCYMLVPDNGLQQLYHIILQKDKIVFTLFWKGIKIKLFDGKLILTVKMLDKCKPEDNLRIIGFKA